MNKLFLEHYMHTAPEGTEQKYIFLTDDREIGFNIIASGYKAILILEQEAGYYNVDSFISYMDEIMLTGTCQSEYCYVPACSEKRINDTLEQYFKQNLMKYHPGWRLFKNKEYLRKTEYQQELKSILSDFIKRFEGRQNEPPDLNRFHKFNEQGKRIGVLDMEIVDYLIQTVHFFMLGNTPYLYKNGCYHEDSNGIQLKSKIQKLIFRDCIKATTIQSIYNLLVSQPQVQKRFSDLNNQPSHWINFQNGYFDVMEWKILEHDAKHLMINQIPFSFHPEQSETILSGGETIRKYLDSSIPDKTDQEMFWQYLGYCMTTDTRFQKFLMIKGKGGTGKSVVISFAQHLIGMENCVSMSLQNLNERFYPTGLFGKLLNACADIPSTAMERVDVIKKAVGEDTLLYEKKGQDPTQFNSYAKLLFSANELPLNLDDKTNAYYRRLLVLDMNHVISDTEKDSHLKEKMYQESDYGIHMAMKALKKLYEEQHFVESDHSKESIENLYRSADSVKAFTDDILCHKKNEKMKRSDVYKMYEDYCEENGRTPHGKSQFWKYMGDKGYSVKRYSDGAYYFKDTALKETEFTEIDDTMENPFEQLHLSSFPENDKNDKNDEINEELLENGA
ncbi:phage/plasmid primase, P4 family [Blautia sp.]|uniref:DNA primase family protein n=1 Tax=Blautia sp. TaxID=1955243 RepID=UPI003521B745